MKEFFLQVVVLLFGKSATQHFFWLHIQSCSAGNLASTYYDQGQLDLAILHYKQAISSDPRFLEAYNNLVGSLDA